MQCCTQVWVGRAEGAQHIARGLVAAGFEATAYNPIAPSRWSVFVWGNAESARELIALAEQFAVKFGKVGV